MKCKFMRIRIAVLMRFSVLGLLGLLAAANVSALSAPAQPDADPYRAFIARFDGWWTGTQAEIVWEAESEVGTAGYRIYRIENKDDAGTPLHEGWIFVDISRSGGLTYRIVDPDAVRGDEVTYRLDELRMQGASRTLGVWTVRFKDAEPAPPHVTVLRDPLEPAPMSAPTAGDALKVPVSSHDIFSVSFADIALGLGLTLSEVVGMALAEPPQLAMHTGGEAVAFLADAEAGRILFYGWPVRLPYTKTNSFWIEAGEGVHVQRMSPDLEHEQPVDPDLTFPALREFEEDHGSLVNRGIMRDDLYFWKHISVNQNNPSMVRAFDAPLDGYASNDVTVAVMLIGWSESPLSPDHKAEILFNDQSLGFVTFDGKSEMKASFTVSSEYVLPENNALQVKGMLQYGHTSSLFVIDAFDLVYKRYYEPADGMLRATDGGNPRLSVERFVDPIVLNISDPHAPVWIADAAGVIPPGSSWAVLPDTEWAMLERTQILQATPYPGGFGEWMLADTNRVDYLVIAPRAFEVPALALADYRESLGLRSAVALYEDICDQFAAGLNTPEAIRDLLIYAHDHWQVAPWMVVLGGRAHFDYLGVITTDPNYLPPLLTSDTVGLRPADARFADLTGDTVPDLAIGRLPVRNIGQFENYIARLKAYEGEGFQERYERAVFVADRNDPSAGDFFESNVKMSRETENRYAVDLAGLDDQTVTEVRNQLLDAFATAGLIHYTGHGNPVLVADWARYLFHALDPADLESPPVPVFIALSCMISRFDNYNFISLGEQLVLQAEGGALAVYAASGLSWNYYSEQFGKKFHHLHAVDRADTLGPTLLHARRSFGELSGLFDVSLRTYNLLGDPALKLRGGESGPPPRWVESYAQWRWERFSYADLAENGALSVTAPSTVAEGEQVSNFILYAMGASPGAGHRPKGLRIHGIDVEHGFIVKWPRRRAARDVDYVLRVSHDLKNWEVDPVDLITFSIGPEPDGVMEWMQSSIYRPETDRLFIELRVQQY